MSFLINNGIPENDLPVKSPSGAARVRYVDGDGKSYSSAMPDVTAASALVQDAIDGVVASAEAEIGVIVNGMGYLPPVAFASGLNVDSSRFTVTYNGVTYAPVADAVPFTTTGTFNPAQWRVVQGVTSADLGASGGASLVGFKQNSADAVHRTIQAKAGDILSSKDFGAIGDGLADDTIAMQRALDALHDGQELHIVGKVRINGTLFLSAKNNVTLNMRNGEFVQASSSGFSLIVHGGSLTRNPSVWQQEILEQAYEDVTPCVGVKIIGFRATATSGKKATQIMFYFADECFFDGEVNDSNGSGVEFRHCVKPSFGTLVVNDATNYALFVYQCHGLIGDLLSATRCGRVYDLKQRHKFYGTWGYVINTVSAFDCRGVEDAAWAVLGGSFRELYRSGGSPAALANRNFAGHEICAGLTVNSHVLTVTDAADPLTTTPSVHIGAFAEKVRFSSITYDANGIDITVAPLIIGSRGDIAEGIAGGATFGQWHSIGQIVGKGFSATSYSEFIQYGVSCEVYGCILTQSRVARVIRQAPAASLPFGAVDSLEFRNADVDIEMPLGFEDQRGVCILAETREFISGGNRIKVKPVVGTSGTCCPLYVAAPRWTVIGRDEVEVVDGGAGAATHTTTYGVFTTAVAGRIAVKSTVFAPTTAYAVRLSNAASTKALRLDPCELVLVGTPTGVKDAIYTTGEVDYVGQHTFVGAFANTLSDTSFKNYRQNRNRIIWDTAAPANGTWAYGDRCFNRTPAVGQPTGWACVVGGSPGTWVSMGNL